jgi:hypothetical protein
MDNCGSKMTVAQLKVAVKEKFPKLAVSKLNKSALLDYFEGRKRPNPKFPKLAPAIVKKLDASKKAGFGNTPKVAALVKDVKAGISAKKVSTMIDSVKTGMAAKKASTKMASAGGGSAPAPAPAPAPKKPSKSSKKVIKTGGANISKAKLARLLTDFSAKNELMIKPYSDRDVKQTYEEDQAERDKDGEELGDFKYVKENLDRYLARYGKTDGGWGESKPQSSVRAALGLIGYELLYAPEYQTYEFVRLRKLLGIEKAVGN